MSPFINVFGLFQIPYFGFFVALGLSVFIVLSLNDPLRKKIISEDAFFDLWLVGIIAGVAGGRLLFIVESDFFSHYTWLDVFKLWDGGLAIMGVLAAVIVALAVSAYVRKLPIVSLFDLAATYAPLAQAIARWGCFFSGCCFGQCMTEPSWWGVVYTDIAHHARPLHVPLHPTQLMMSAFSFSTFLLIRLFIRPIFGHIPGVVFSWYLVLASTERIIVDFYRGDRTHVWYITDNLGLSFHQQAAVGLLLFGVASLLICHLLHRKKALR